MAGYRQSTLSISRYPPGETVRFDGLRGSAVGWADSRARATT